MCWTMVILFKRKGWGASLLWSINLTGVSLRQLPKEYFMGKVGLAKRQLLCELNGNAVKLQVGAM